MRYKAQKGWTFAWSSSFGSDVNGDLHVTLDETVAPVAYNFLDQADLVEAGMGWLADGSSEQPGYSVFLRVDDVRGRRAELPQLSRPGPAPPGCLNAAMRRALPTRVAVAATAAIMSLGGLVAAPGAAATTPIQPANQPTPIAGATNGELPQSDLVNVAPGCEAARAAAPSLSRLLATARQDGVVLGTEQCYRSLADQQQEVQDWTTAGNSACAAPVNPTPAGPSDTSMHGWGKAADFFDADGTVAFGSPGYAFLVANAGRFGWNHPAWAQPGGSACPEAWHWEWVGDGGVQAGTPIRADVVALIPTADGAGYSTVTGLGAMANLGDAIDRGSPADEAIAWVITAAARTPDGGGYWLVGAGGEVYAYGDAKDLGSISGLGLNSSVVGMAATPDGGGYWLLAGDGGIFSFGDARYFGSTGALRLNSPIVGMAATPDESGYWLVAADGGVFSFGDARYFGSTGALRLNSPIVGMAATPDGGGYWLVAADGGVFTFGDAAFRGSGAAGPLPEPAVGLARTADGHGYWIVAADGAVLAFGDASPLGTG